LDAPSPIDGLVECEIALLPRSHDSDIFDLHWTDTQTTHTLVGEIKQRIETLDGSRLVYLNRSGRIRTHDHWFWSSVVAILPCTTQSNLVLFRS